VGNSATLYPTYCGDKKNFQKSYTNDIPRVKTGKTPRRRCLNHNLFAVVNKAQRALLVRDGAIDPGRFRNDGLGLRIGSTVLGRALGASTMGQPS
jgi:hypothetical protein